MSGGAVPGVQGPRVTSTAVKRLSMREKLHGDRIVRFGKTLHVAVTTAAPSCNCELEAKFSFYFNVHRR